jgi:hypothetical protein
MRSYDPPPETDGLTAAEASKRVNALNAACAGDPDHPYFCGNHAQHKDFVDYSRQLHRIIIEAEAEEKDAAAAQKLEDARAVTGDLTPAECMARGKKLLKTPGFLDGKMEPEARAELQRQIDAMFLVGCQEPEPEPEPEPSTEEMENSDDL